MGSRGPTPNPNADQRERKHGWTTLANQPPSGPVPDLVGGHTDRGRDLWASWWATPMATMWGPFDAPSLERLVSLHEAFWLGQTSAAAEIRQLEDRFGLTPAARRRLMWQVEGVDIPASDPHALGRATASRRPAAGGADDPRLQVVQGGRTG